MIDQETQNKNLFALLIHDTKNDEWSFEMSHISLPVDFEDGPIEILTASSVEESLNNPKPHPHKVGWRFKVPNDGTEKVMAYVEEKIRSYGFDREINDLVFSVWE